MPIGTPRTIFSCIKSDIPDSIEGGEALLDRVGRPHRLPMGISDAHLDRLAVRPNEAISEMKTDEMALISVHLGDALMGCYGKGRNPDFEFSRSAFGNNHLYNCDYGDYRYDMRYTDTF